MKPPDGTGAAGLDELLVTEVVEMLAGSAYGARPTSGRRTRAQIRSLRELMVTTLTREQPMTVRQVFYRLVTLGAIDKTETEYKSTVVRLLGDLRREGEIPYSWIVDNVRWMRKPRTFRSLESALRITAETYRRSLWDHQDVYVEIWLEKDALSGVVYDVTANYDVGLHVTRGYPSLSFLHSAAEAIEAQEKPAWLYYFGDRDPSGVHIPVKIEETLRGMTDAEINFSVVAVTEDQIEAFELPTRPTKQSDSRAKQFRGESVELDAIPAQDLRDLVRECIEAHIDPDMLATTERIEAEERETLREMVEGI